MNWSEAARGIPMVLTVLAQNNEETVFSCLQSAYGQFEAIIVIVENSSDNTSLEIDRFIRRERVKNVHVFDMTTENPWPQAEMSSKIFKKSSSVKKAHSLVKRYAPDCLWFSITADTILDKGSRQVVNNSVVGWDNPAIGHSFVRLLHTEADTLSNAITSISTDTFVMWVGGLLTVGPDTCDPKSPSFYLESDGKVMKTIFNIEHCSGLVGLRVSKCNSCQILTHDKVAAESDMIKKIRNLRLMKNGSRE